MLPDAFITAAPLTNTVGLPPLLYRGLRLEICVFVDFRVNLEFEIVKRMCFEKNQNYKRSGSGQNLLLGTDRRSAVSRSLHGVRVGAQARTPSR